MNRRVALMAVLLLAGVIGYHMVTSGKISAGSGANLSPEEQQLNALETRLQDARRDINSAGQSAGFTGMDTSAEVDRAIHRVEQVEKELEALQMKTRSQAVRERCSSLLSEAHSIAGS